MKQVLEVETEQALGLSASPAQVTATWRQQCVPRAARRQRMENGEEKVGGKWAMLGLAAFVRTWAFL